MGYVAASSSEKVVDTKNLISLFDQSFAEVRSEEACPSSNEDFFRYAITHGMCLYAPTADFLEKVDGDNGAAN